MTTEIAEAREVLFENWQLLRMQARYEAKIFKELHAGKFSNIGEARRALRNYLAHKFKVEKEFLIGLEREILGS